ncbi:MAG: hypothetical protein K0R08_1703 [Solimicrobium sp.]|nr:hypothetical protein [Solimicrobium sp.]
MQRSLKVDTGMSIILKYGGSPRLNTESSCTLFLAVISINSGDIVPIMSANFMVETSA